MDLMNQTFNRSGITTRSRDEDARLRCQLSKVLEEAGDYERARAAMGDLWHRVGERPSLEGLGRGAAAEVLLQAGRLTGSIGSSKQLGGSQEAAKNLISESLSTFEELRDEKKVAEAQTELGVCYWREGALDEARVMLKEALARLNDSDGELRAAALLRLAIVERTAQRYDLALALLNEAAPLAHSSGNEGLLGRFHNQLATTLENYGRAERRREKIDQALIEYAAAGIHFEQAGHLRYCARVENNLGFLFSTLGRFDEAHEHIDRAREIFTRLRDQGSVAQVDDTRARAFITEGRLEDAERVARASVRSLEAGGEQALLAEALTTHGTALARLGQFERSRLSFERAVETARRAGHTEGAGLAALALVEELCDHTPARDLAEAFELSSETLSGSRHTGILTRLNACALRVVRALSSSPGSSGAAACEESFSAPGSDGRGEFSLKQEVHRYEAELIRRALNEADGVVSRAAKLLGFRHHQTFVALLNNRHKDLLHARRPIVPRGRKVVRLRARRGTPQHRADREARPVSILFVEDNQPVADAIKETLEIEGWRVTACPDGASALKEVEGDAHFDLLLLDEDLPGASGLEIARRARTLVNRRRTPIIIISATDCQSAARAAGANAFMKKPQDILSLVPTISRLLQSEPSAR